MNFEAPLRLRVLVSIARAPMQPAGYHAPFAGVEYRSVISECLRLAVRRVIVRVPGQGPCGGFVYALSDSKRAATAL